MSHGDPDRPTGIAPQLRSLVGSITAALVVIALGVMVFPSDRATAITRTSAVLLPAPALEPSEKAGYYELLSQGTITGSLAELLRQPRFLDAARRTTPGVGVDELVSRVVVVPDTAVLRFELEGPTREITERISDEVITAWRSEVQTVTPAYTALEIGRATESNRTPGWLRVVLGCLVLAAAGLTGVVTYLLLQRRSGTHVPWISAVHGLIAGRRPVQSSDPPGHGPGWGARRPAPAGPGGDRERKTMHSAAERAGATGPGLVP